MRSEKAKYKSGYNYKSIRKEQEARKTVPSFGFKSAFIIILTAILTAVLIPYAFSLIGVNTKVIPLVASTIGIPLAVCYCQSYMETKKGFTKSSIIVFIILAIFIAIISYFWLYIGLYI